MNLPTLRADRVVLRELHDGDVPALLEVFGDPDVARFMGIRLLADLDDARALLAEIDAGRERGDLLQWGISRQDGVIGTVTLFRIEARHRRAELGFALGRAWWRQGLATEAVNAVLAFALGEMGLHRIEADTDPRNAASMRVLERVGFRREGYARQRWWTDTEVQDAVLFGLLAPEWTGSGPAARSV